MSVVVDKWNVDSEWDNVVSLMARENICVSAEDS